MATAVVFMHVKMTNKLAIWAWHFVIFLFPANFIIQAWVFHAAKYQLSHFAISDIMNKNLVIQAWVNHDSSTNFHTLPFHWFRLYW